MTYNLAIRKSIYKWRENNIEKYTAYNILQNQIYKAKNKQRLNEIEKLRHRYKAEAKRMRNILLCDDENI